MRQQLPIKTGVILFGLFNLVIIGAGHGVVPIGLMMYGVLFWGDFPFDHNMFLLLLGWPATFILLFELIYAKSRSQKLRPFLFFISALLYSLSIFGLIGFSDAPGFSFVTALPFFIGLLVYLISFSKKASEA